jgi:UDP-N-acetylglucosamine transferase subunit ALG13
MILVMLGTQNNSFERLLKKMDELIEKKVIDEKVIVQSGYTNYESKNMRIFDLIPQEELEKFQEQADLIITHGGVGSIVSSIKKGKKVIAVPRLHRYHEHVNDHQKQIVEAFDKKGYIIGIQRIDELRKAIISAQDFVPKKYEENNISNSKILKIIEDFIDNI